MSTASHIDRIAVLLAAADEERRLEGVRELDGAFPDDCPPLLFQALGDPSWRVRKEAADLFLRRESCRARTGEVVALLYAEENAGLRNAAVDILVRLGRVAVPPLLDEVRSADHDVRKFAIDILGEIGDQRAVPLLLAALGDDDGNVRAAAAENLGKLRAAEAVPALLDAMRHPDLLLRFTILESLGRIGAAVPLARLLPFRDDQLLRKALIDCLGRVGDAAAVNELLEGLSDPMRNVRDASLPAIVALAERYPDEVAGRMAEGDFPSAVEAALGYLGDGQPPAQRLAAVKVLQFLASPRAVAPLLDRLNDESLQHAALTALVAICRRHPAELCRTWPRATSLHRAYLAYVFGEAGCASGVPLLTEALAADDPRLVQMAAHALGRLGGPAELAPLAACLRHADGDVRDAATNALGELGGRHPQPVLAALEPLLGDAEPLRRTAAVSVLGRIGAADFAPRLAMALKDPAAAVRRAALKGLAGAPLDEHLLTIQLALSDEDVEVRRAAAELLGGSGAAEAAQGLHLALADEDMWVRAAAVRALGRLGGAGEAEAVAALVGDPVGLVSIAALETLGELLGAQACPRLCAALDHPDEEVVAAALDLLARYGEPGWLAANAEALLGHPAWHVRAHCARLLAALLGEQARPALERRLAAESDELVRRQIADALAPIAP